MAVFHEPACGKCGIRGHFSVWSSAPKHDLQVVYCYECGCPAGALEDTHSKAVKILNAKIDDLESRIKRLESK
jgi:hypothetical protein